MQEDKNIIKKLLRESLENISSENDDLLTEKSVRKLKKKLKKDYADIINYFNSTPHFSQVDVMTAALGLPDDEDGTNRSLFNKKLHQKKNKETGSLYQFDDLELDKIRTAIKLKSA